MSNPYKTENPQTIVIKRPPYGFGLLCLIPMFGAFVGLFLVALGVFHYRDKKLTFIGLGGIAFTIGFYFFLGIYSAHLNLRPDIAKSLNNQMTDMAQSELNQLVTQIEFYQLQKGRYPDSLPDLTANKQMVMDMDPFIRSSFAYKKNAKGYVLLSVGPDKIPYTQDDIYPNVIAEKPGTMFGYKRKP